MMCSVFVTWVISSGSTQKFFHSGEIFICNCQNLLGQDAKLKAMQLYIQMYYVCGIAYISKCP